MATVAEYQSVIKLAKINTLAVATHDSTGGPLLIISLPQMKLKTKIRTAEIKPRLIDLNLIDESNNSHTIIMWLIIR